MAHKIVELCIYWQVSIGGLDCERTRKLNFNLSGCEDLAYLMKHDGFGDKISYDSIETVVSRYARLIKEYKFLSPGKDWSDTEWSFNIMTMDREKRSMIMGKRANYVIDLEPLRPSEVARMNAQFCKELGPEFYYGRIENLKGYSISV